MSRESKKILITIYPFLFLGYILFYVFAELGIFSASSNILMRAIGLLVLIYAVFYFSILYKRIKNGYVPDKTKPNYTQMVLYGILGLASGWIPLMFMYIFFRFRGMDAASIIFYIMWVIYFARIGYYKKREIINF